MKTLTYLCSLLTSFSLLAFPTDAKAHSSFHFKSFVPTESVSTEFGFTKVQFDQSLIDTLDTLDIRVSRLAPSTVFLNRKGCASFPIAGGIFDPVATTAEILHRGGLILSTDDVTVVLSSFIIEVPTSGDPVLTALLTVDGTLEGRISLFDVDLANADIDLKRNVLCVSDVALTLSADAATALNTAFGVTDFVSGDAVGEARVVAGLRSLRPDKHSKPRHHHHHDGDDDDDDHDGHHGDDDDDHDGHHGDGDDDDQGEDD